MKLPTKKFIIFLTGILLNGTFHYLDEVGLIMKLTNITKNIIDNVSNDKDKAVLIHNFVRDKVRFGFSRKLDLGSPEETLLLGYGNSNSKGVLFMKMLKEANINSQMHFVTIKKDLYFKTMPDLIYNILPSYLTHGFVEVNINGKYLKVDSYSIDKVLFGKVKVLLKEEELESGFGTFAKANSDWDGEIDNFSQVKIPDMIVEDHGSFENPSVYFNEYDSYKHKFLSLQYADMINGFADFFNIPIEIYLNSILNHYRGME